MRKKRVKETYEDVEKRIKQWKNEDSEEHKYDNWAEILKDSFPQWKKPFCQGECFVFLCIQMRTFMENEFSKENQQSLRLAKDNFDSYCETCLKYKAR